MAAIEAALGFKVPHDLIQFWKFANGTPEEFPVFCAKTDEYTEYNFYSTQRAKDFLYGPLSHEPLEEGRDARIAPIWWSDRWIPFAGYNGGTSLAMIDLDPSPKGTPGQIIAFQHDADAIYWVSDSFSEFLANSLFLFSQNLMAVLESIEFYKKHFSAGT